MAAMRIAGFVAAGLVLGFALGQIPAERERGALEKRAADLELALRQSHRPNILDNFLPKLGGSPAAMGSDERTPTPRVQRPAAVDATPDGGTRAHEADPTPQGQGSVAVVGKRPDARPRRGGLLRRWGRERRDDRQDGDGFGAEGQRERLDPSDDTRAAQGLRLLQRFNQVATVQQARAAASRVALIEQAKLQPAQIAQMDQTVHRMNSQLAGYGEEMINQMGNEEPPSPAQALGLGHDVSGILLEGQTELENIVGEAAKDVEPSALEVWNYVDIEQWRPFVEQQLPTDAPAAADGEGQQ